MRSIVVGVIPHSISARLKTPKIKNKIYSDIFLLQLVVRFQFIAMFTLQHIPTSPIPNDTDISSAVSALLVGTSTKGCTPQTPGSAQNLIGRFCRKANPFPRLCGNLSRIFSILLGRIIGRHARKPG